MKAINILVAASAAFLATPALATDSGYSFSSTSNTGAVFAGYFSITGSAGAYSLVDFSGNYAGFTYDMSNVGLLNDENRILIGGTSINVDAIQSGQDDFWIGYFNPIGFTGVASGMISSKGEAYQEVVFSITNGVTPPAGTGAVPEPATWGMMLVGFGAIGLAMRRPRKIVPRISYAG